MVNGTREQRESPRLNLKLEVEFLGKEEDRHHSRQGATENVSAGGVYISTVEWEGLEVGQEVALRISGLSGQGIGPLFRSLRVTAKVLRVDPPKRQENSFERGGVATRFCERPSFETFDWSS